MNIKDNIMNTLLELVSVPGIAGTEAENMTAEKIKDILSKIPYFSNNPQKINVVDIKGDPLNRKFVSALFCSTKPSKKTVIITGHLDVVDVQEFGALKDLAFKPLELIKRIRELNLTEEAVEDLNSGEWIFGRGTADMKYGLALGIEILRELSNRDDFEGNILFLAVPGEESNSEGMLAAVPYLLDLKNNLQLEYISLFVSECCIPKGTGDNKKRIYLGTSGKLMPLFLFVGKETHVYESYTGLNPNLMASELNRLLDLNPDFCQVDRGNFTPPPICLKQTDLKDLYSVQTPLMAAAYYNILTLNLCIDEVICKLKEIAVQAFKSSIDIANKNVEKYSKISSINVKRNDINPLVITYEELYEKVKKIRGSEFDLYIEQKVKQWISEKKDLQTIAINIMKETYMSCPDKVPMIILGFAPPYYPDKHLSERNKEDVKLLEVINDVVNYASSNFNENIELDHYYMGLCDLSYTGVEDEDKLNKIASNIIGIDKSYSLPVKELGILNIPSVVFGGFGKDFHKCSERLNLKYSFEVVPSLYEKAIYKLFE